MRYFIEKILKKPEKSVEIQTKKGKNSDLIVTLIFY